MVPRIEVKTKGLNSRVYVNGQELHGVRTVHFTHEAGKLPVMSVDYVAADLYLDGEFVPTLPHPFDKWYEHKKTPPCDDEATSAKAGL